MRRNAERRLPPAYDNSKLEYQAHVNFYHGGTENTEENGKSSVDSVSPW